MPCSVCNTSCVSSKATWCAELTAAVAIHIRNAEYLMLADDDHEVEREGVVVIVIDLYELWQDTDDRRPSRINIGGNDETPTRKQMFTGYSRLIFTTKSYTSSSLRHHLTHLPMHVFGLKKSALQAGWQGRAAKGIQPRRIELLPHPVELYVMARMHDTISP